MKKEFEFKITEDQTGERLDAFLTMQEEIDLTRSQVNKLVKDGQVLVNGKPAKPGNKLKLDDEVKITIPKPQKLEAVAEDIPLKIVYEDKDLIVINKPRGMVVHPAAGNYSGTLVNALLHHCKDLSGIGGVMRPGIVHRLDKDTSGLIVVAKNDFAHQSLTKQFKDREVNKQYIALVHGEIKDDEGVIETEIGRNPHDRKKMAVIKSEPKFFGSKQKGKEAITQYKVLNRYTVRGGLASGGKEYTLLAITIKTGRTHQIRVHLKHIGHAVVGDPTYGHRREKFKTSGQLLHAAKLAFTHPRTNKLVEFEAELPEDMERILGLLG